MNYIRGMSVSQLPPSHWKPHIFILTCPLLPLKYAVHSGLQIWGYYSCSMVEAVEDIVLSLCFINSNGIVSISLLLLAQDSCLRIDTALELLVSCWPAFLWRSIFTMWANQ